jgi:glycosyltransferase involved in cell wall biosynthesis
MFKPNFSEGDYLAFLGRLSPEKGPHLAIKWARFSGLPLRIAAKIPTGENRFIKKEIEPFLDGQMVQFVGEVNDSKKTSFLSHAKALLFPIDWPEPFGLVMIEAMACGTPVIAYPRGSVPEIIEDGVTGFLVENEEQAIEAIKRIHTLDRHRVRAEFERRFSVHRMAQDYVRCYEQVAIGLPRKNARALDRVRSANPGDMQTHPLSSLGLMSSPLDNSRSTEDP